MFGKLIGELGVLLALGGIRRFQHRELCRNGIIAGVLFVLGGMQARVVRHAQNHAAVYADITHGKERVGCHIEADMLHGAEGTRAAEGCAGGNLCRHLFVGRPFAENFIVLRGRLRNLRAWCSGVAGNHPHTGLIEAAGNGLVAQVELFHENLPLN